MNMANPEYKSLAESYDSITYSSSSLLESLKFLNSSDFKSKVKNIDTIYDISVKISSVIGKKLNDTSFAHCFDINHSILISFESIETKEIKIFWKLPCDEEFYFLELTRHYSELVTDFCRGFLVGEIKKGATGILKNSQSKEIIEIHDIGNEDDQHLLILAALENNVEVVQKLLEFKLNVEHNDNDQHCAIDKAWLLYSESKDNESKERSNKIFLMLLKANSAHPAEVLGFEYGKASKDVREFIDMCENIHKDVQDGSFESLKRQLKLNPQLRHFYNQDGDSLIANRSISRDANKLNRLFSVGLSPGYYEDIEDIYRNIDKKFHKIVRQQHEVCAKQMPRVHLSVLKLKSKIGGNDSKHDERWKYIEDAFEILNQNKLCSKILKVVAAWNNLQIIFDFKQDTVYYLDPTKSESVRGTTYNSGKIYIGAQHLMSQESKFNVISVMIHELCHFAVLITFMNNFDPYPVSESEAKRRFDRIVAVECERNKEFEPLVSNVYDTYEKSLLHSELIVLAAQMLMHYYVKDSKIECENSKKIAEIEQKYGELFKYFKDVVEPELERAVKMLKLLQDTNQQLNYNGLTGPMKAKVLHSKINFQEEETTFFEVVGNDLEVLNGIPSDTLRAILLENKMINISEIFKRKAKYSIIERRFTSHENPFSNPICLGNFNSSANEFKQITSVVKDVKMFILSDTAGSGKTTSFIHLTKILKKEYKTFWVVYIKLRVYQEIFEEYRKFLRSLNKGRVLELFLKMLNFDSQMDTKIFTKLFNENKAILLLDGIDEICPNYNELIIEIIDVLKQSTENQLWISTRPQHATQLDQKFKVPIYKFQPYTENDIDEFIAEILKVLLPQKEDTQNEALQFLKNFLKSIEESFSSKDYNVNNPLMIKVITELHVNGEINLQSTNLNIFKVFEKIVDKQIEKIDGKIQHGDRRSFMETSIESVHQVFSILFLIKSKPDLEKLNNLSIFVNWKKVKDEWTSEKIQRYGFMTVDVNDQNSVDFTHRTYAEFFLTKLIVSHIFEDSINVSNEERETIYKLFLNILNQRLFYGFICALLLSYVKNAAHENSLVWHENVKNLIIKEISNVRDQIFQTKNHSSTSKFSDFVKSMLTKKFKEFKIFKVVENFFNSNMHHAMIEEKSDVEFSSNNYIDDEDDVDPNINVYNYKGISESVDEITNEKNTNDCEMQVNLIDEALANIKYLELFVYILKSEPKHINNLWLVGKTENLLYNILTSDLICNFECLKCILEVLEHSFGSNFHLIFTKNSKNRLIDEDIDELAGGKIICNLSKNLLKLLDLVKTCYKIEEIKSINSKILHQCLILDHVEYEIQMKIFLEVSEVFRSTNDEFLNFLIMSVETSSLNVCKYIGDNIEKFLRNNENNIQRFLSYKYAGDHILIKALISNRADVFKTYRELYAKYIANNDRIQEKFVTRCDLSYLFFTMNDETYQEFKNFMIYRFSTNKDIIFHFPEYHKAIPDRISRAFALFEDFASSYFDNDAEKMKNFARKVFPFSCLEENNPLIDSAKLDSKDMLVTYKKLFTKYLYSFDELQSNFFTNCYIPEILLCVRPDVYPEFKKLVKEMFIFNENLISECLKDGCDITTKTIVRSNSFTEAIKFSVYNENTNKLGAVQRKTIVGLRDLEENEKYWIKAELLSIRSKIKLFEDLILFLFMEDPVIGWAMIKESLFQTRQIWDYLFMRNINTNYWLKIETITNEQKLEHFEEISLCYCAGDAAESRNFIRKILFYDNNPDYHSFHRVIKMGNLEKFKRFKKFYIKYKNSWEELQEIFISFCDLHRIFSEITDEIYLELQDLLLEIFVTNKDKIFDCINRNSWMYYHPENTMKMFKNFENLSSVLFINNKIKSKAFMRQIVFHKYWINYHPLIESTLSKTVDEFIFYKDLCMKYMNSGEEIQEYLLKWNFIPHVLLQAEPEVYSQFMMFIKEIFNSDVQKINEFMCESYL